MTTYVLVHGAWHGGWCWRRVGRTLKVTGSDVYTPTLTGLGERAHLASREVDLETHIGDVLGVIEVEDLTEIVLVGHSYGGIVVTAVADRAAQRIAHLVYLDAVVPRDGQCLYDCTPAQIKTHFEEQARIGGEGWRVPVAVASAQFLGLKHEEDLRWVMPKLTPHPIRTFREAVRLGSKLPPVPRTYINCIGDKALGQPKTMQADGIDDYHELRTGHDAMVTAPQDVADLLRKVAETASDSAQSRAAADARRAGPWAR
jgi:pimeloyl-ACP methyl ester carboxylesterase